MRSLALAFLFGLALAACAAQPKPDHGASPNAAASSAGEAAQPADPSSSVERSTAIREPYGSTYSVRAAESVLIHGATVLTGTGSRLDDADVLIVEGTIAAVGHSVEAPPGARRFDARGKWVTPGLIDAHSHNGVYAAPDVSAHADGNEASGLVTANVWAEHALWPQDPGFEKARQGGVTTMQVLPGSANLIAGRGVTIKNVAATTYQAMKFPGAPHGLKMTCGENPKKIHGAMKGQGLTRMGNVAGYRQAFADAQDYQRQREKYQRELAAYEKKAAKGAARGQAHAGKDDEDEAQPPVEPKRDLGFETLVAAMSGDILVHIHCYRADEMALMLDVAQEFGFQVAAFHHGVEAYKIADRLAEAGVCGALWADWWGFKMEAWDAIQENIALVDRPREGCAIVHSDSAEGIQRLNQEAAKAMMRGQRAGLPIAPERAIRWITANPARALGILDRTGTLEAGKMADVAIWNRNPFSVYALAEQVFIDGALVFDRREPPLQPSSDFQLGQHGEWSTP